MSDLIRVYLLDEAIYSDIPEGSTNFAELYQAIVTRTIREGILWASLEIGLAEFWEALERIDRLLFGGKKLLPVAAATFSPGFRRRGASSADTPPFGYYYPALVEDLAAVVAMHPPEGLAAVRSLPYQAVVEAVCAAAGQGKAVAVVYGDGGQT